MMNPAPTPRRPRGTIYLLVLMTVVLATVLVLGGLYTITSRRVTVDLELSRAAARVEAESGLELGVYFAKNTMTWRQASKTSPVVSPTMVGNGSFSVYTADPVDGDVANSLTDPVRLLSYGSRNTANQMVVAILDPDWTPMSCMGVALCANGSINVNGGTIRCIGAIASNGSVTASSAAIQPDVYAVGTISGSAYVGNNTAGVTAREMPTVAAFDYYTTVGTAITYNSCGGKLDRVVLGPGRNPYGSTNALGIYVIDCQNNDFTLRDCRIVGTLVLLNAGSGTLIRNSVTMEQAVAGNPVLLVQGNLTFSNTAITDLSESSTGTNFNPASTPYKGQSDTDTSDFYPTVLQGLVGVSGNLTVSSDAAVDGGLIVGGAVSISSNLTLYYRLNGQTAPPGFVTGAGFTIRPGSWARLVY